MNKHKAKLRRAMWGIGIFLTLLLILVLLSPKLINLDPIRERIQASVSIPVKIKGDLENPKVSPLILSEVESNLLGVMKRTLKAPVKLMEAIIPGGIEGW
jgi:ABC-type microcin C transport system permease subunit YejE